MGGGHEHYGLTDPPKNPASETGGVKPMTITGRMVRERERCIGMTADERAWRAQWLKDQHLSPREPVHVPEFWHAIRNPIRRFYRAPLDAFWHKLTPTLVISLEVLRNLPE